MLTSLRNITHYHAETSNSIQVRFACCKEMDDFMPELHPPETPDYYADLGLQQTATFPEIKRAFYLLAKKHHPDKQGPGVCVDAHEFRKVSLVIALRLSR